MAPGGLSVRESRSSNHHISVLVYKHDLSYTQAERPTDRGKMTPSLPLSRDSRRDPETSHHKDRGGRLRSTPLHTSTPSPRARRRGRPAPRYTRSSSGERAAHVIPQSEPTTSSHSKSNTRRETSRARTNQGPGPAPPRRPLHAIERPAKEPRHQSKRKQTPCTHRNTLGPPSKP